jgi:DNA-binding transcriptional MerR regulator
MLTTGDLARLSNNSLRTIRFYEEAGFLKPVLPNDGGHRLFPETELDKLRYVTDLRAAGFSLDEIRDALDVKRRLHEAQARNSSELVGLLDAQIDVVSERLSRLARLRDELRRTRAALGASSVCSQPDLLPEHHAQCQSLHDSSKSSPFNVLWSAPR